MRKILFSLLAILFIGSIGFMINKFQFDDTNKEVAELREQHEHFLENSPFKETLKLSKKERKAMRISPNKFMERNWELTMNPATGQPEPEKLFELQERLQKESIKGTSSFAKVPGEVSNNWVERGPDNVGGRTRAMMFDPNDATNKRVFAGGVSGGLWVNNDITADSPWEEVNIPSNLAVSCITYDPNNTNVFYLGTGESYVQGSVNGNGVWKSVNGGTSWFRVFGGVSGDTNIIPGASNSRNARVTVNTPAGIAGDYFGIRASFGESLTPISGNLVLADDGTATPNEACGSLVNAGAINGNIAVIYRGNCDFSQKVLNAQSAGAVAVVMINNLINAAPIEMGAGASGDLVTIPSLMLSLADGEALVDQLGSGVNVSMNGYRNYSGYTAKPGSQHINDIKIRDIGGGNSEVYIAASSAFYSDASPNVFLGVEDFGLYKSTNSGSSWSKITLLPSSNSNDYQLQPNDIEIAADNTIWLSATGDLFRDGGGEILSSTDGTNFTLRHKVPSGMRTQIAVSGTNANTLYVLAELSSETTGVKIIHTDDGFATTTSLSLPVDVDTDIAADDFTFGQAFYNLLIEVDPTNDAIVYAGGIDLFRSADTGNTWTQIAEYYTSTGLSAVHPDHHAFVFNPSDSNKAINGNDGGVYYATALSTTPSIVTRNKNYNTLQFYHGAIGQEVANEKFLAGAQDNGSQLINNATAGVNSSSSPTGGDGTYVFIDKDNEYLVTSVQNGNYYYRDYATGVTDGYTIEGGNLGGEFVNPAALDSDNNYLFTTASGGVNRYKLTTTAATADVLSDASLIGSVTAFKVSNLTSSPTLFMGTDSGKLVKLINSTSSKTFTQTWSDLTGPSFVGSISSIELGASESEIYVTFYNYGVSNVFYTSNGGATWQNKEGGLPDIPVRDIMANPLNANEVIVATDLGVWGTSNFNDASPDWYRSQNGMKDVIVTSFDFRTADNTVLASTYGRGVFTGQFTAAPSELSINDKALNNLVKIFPTISNGNFNISAKSEIRQGDINIFDLNGREVFASKIDFNRNPIQAISINTSSGMYIVKFKSDNRYSTYKIIIE